MVSDSNVKRVEEGRIRAEAVVYRVELGRQMFLTSLPDPLP